ncbi:CLUMA_CG008678, isoform A [Clunio marinus]|uniref:CLUMA_CG008678, isoform A n=1 Tax=Clunio marinus TaxID=568069 RepID=A0A1J1I4X1_9DIPT|nr:CLUMA_CG008678, isoform A [Clunio marinus]
MKLSNISTSLLKTKKWIKISSTNK